MPNLSIASRLPLPRARDAALALGGAALLAASAWVRVPMWPVPMTMQTLAVLLIGATGGAWVGGGSVALYLAAAGLGLPVIAGAGLGGPTFGYLIGFLLAAVATGVLVQGGWSRGLRLLVALLVGEVLIYLPGLLWLDLGFMHDWRAVVAAGLVPFVVGDGVKLALAYALLCRVQPEVG